MSKVLKTSYIIPDLKVVREAVNTIMECKLVVGATDTLYGIFANPFQYECVERVYIVKKRTRKPIPLLADSIDSIIEHVVVDNKIIKFLEMIGYGPVTIILKLDHRSKIAENIHLKTFKVGFRIPASQLVRLIAKEVGGLVTGTSANISGLKPARTVNEAFSQFGDSVDLYIDSGYSPLGVGSTVIDLTEGFKVIRYGVVNPKILKKLYEMI